MEGPASCLAVGRRAARRQDRRDAILATAARSFLDHGYAGTTMSAVAASLGGSKGTLWSYFPSKEALFTAVIDERTTDFRARLSAVLDPGDDLTPSLERFCTGFLTKVTSAEAIALHRLVVAEASRFPEIGRIFHDRAPRQMQTLLGGFLEGAMQRGQLREGEPIEAARLLMHLCLAGCHQLLLTGLIPPPAADQIAADVATALRLFLRAYAVAPLNPAG